MAIAGQVKTKEIAERIADNIRTAVREEVDRQLRPVKDTMLDLIDRVGILEGEEPFEVDDESDGEDRQERAEAVAFPEPVELVPGQVLEGADGPGSDEDEGPTGR